MRKYADGLRNPAVNGIWAVPTGIAMLLEASRRIETYGIVMAVYGGANLFGTLALTLLSRLSSSTLFYIGATIQGIGIVLICSLRLARPSLPSAASP